MSLLPPRKKGPSDEEIARIVLQRRAARENFAEFCKYLSPDEPPAKHHILLCDALDDVVDGKLNRLMVFMPPGSAKSTYSSINFPAYYLGRSPEESIICGSYGEGLSTRFGRKVRNLVTSGEYGTLFKTRLSEDAKAKGEWENAEGGSYYACISPETPIKTKRGVVSACDVIIGDEIITHNGYASVNEVINSFHKETIVIDNLSMSKDHPVWTYNRGWLKAKEVCTTDLMHVECIFDIIRSLIVRAYYGGNMEHTNVSTVVQHESEVHSSQKRKMEGLWWSRNFCLRKMDGFRELCCGYWGEAYSKAHYWANRQRWPVFSRELSMGGCFSADEQHALKCQDRWKNASAAFSGVRNNHVSDSLSHEKRNGSTGKREETKTNVWGYSNPEANGWFRSIAIQVFNGCCKKSSSGKIQDSKKCNRTRIEKGAKKLLGLFVGVRTPVEINHVKHNSREFINYRVDKGNTFFAKGILTHNCGVGSGVTGRRATLLVIDDPVKGRKEADSETVRNETWEWYRADALTRLKPDSSQIIIQTRWHEDDLSGRILPDDWNGESGDFKGFDGQTWKVICLPAQARENDVLGREVGDWLWPEYFHKQFWEETKKIQTAKDYRNWNSLYQQVPQPDSGVFFKREWFNRYKLGEEPPLSMYGASDYAVSDGKGDFTEHGVGGFSKINDLYFTQWWSGQTTPDKWIESQLRMVRDAKPYCWCAEVGVIRRAVEPFLKKQMKESKTYFRMEWLSHIGDKGANARSFQALASMGKVWIPYCEWGEELVDQLVKFIPNTNYRDDKVDVCGLFGRILDQAFAPTEPEIVKREERDEYGFDNEPSATWKLM